MSISKITEGQVTGDDLVAGQRIWAVGYVFGAGDVPVELIVVDGRVEPESTKIRVTYVDPNDARTHAASASSLRDELYLFLGDRGVRPYNYDNRVSQVFFTRKALENALELWNGKNPNFIYV